MLFSNFSDKKILYQTKKIFNSLKSIFTIENTLSIFFFLFSEMEKRRNWLIEIYLSLGNCLCDLSTINDDQSTYLTNILKILPKHIDINDGKLTNFLYKYYLNRKSYGRAWKILLKQIEEKSSSQQQELDQKLLQVNEFLSIKEFLQCFSFSFIKQ